jgi:uncharacterized protein with NAD-binding domain and iron-sulfur cluster
MLPRPERVVERFPLVQDPPFELRGVRSFLFVVPCPEGSLAALIARTFDWARPDVQVQPLAGAAILVATDVLGGASAGNPLLGSFTYRELTVFVPVLLTQEGRTRLALHVPFIYPNEGLAVAAGREVYGLPKKPAQLAVPDPDAFWSGRAAIEASVLGAATFDGTPWTQQALLTVRSQPQDVAATLEDHFLDAIDAHFARPDGSGALGKLLQQDLVQLKQVADVTTGGLPPRLLYRAVTSVVAPVQNLRDIHVAKGEAVTIDVARVASDPVADVLGLSGPVAPLLAASFTMDFAFRDGTVLREEPSSGVVPPRKTRVLVLGGGMGALATAHALSDTEERRNKYDVHVLAQGHQLGGKGASHRQLAVGARSEEHGLHVLFGFYHNALKLLRGVYSEAARPDGTFPKTYDEAFAPQWDVTFSDGVNSFDATFPVTKTGHGALPRSTSERVDLFKSLLDTATGGSFGKMLAGGVFPLFRNKIAREVMAFAVTLVTGVVADILVGGRSWDDLDGMDFRDWMKKHHIFGFPDLSATPIMQVPYDGVFAYDGPDQSHPRLGAGIAARGLLQLVTDYEVAPYHAMTSGMAECVFAPLYEVLKARGVAIEPFAKVKELVIRDGQAASVVYGRQAVVTAGPTAYVPTVVTRTPAGDIATWPDAPDFTQLESPCPLEGRDPYSDADDAQVGPDRQLQLGRDFDVVVCALPAPVTAFVLRGHEKVPALAAIAEIPTVATLHLQMWLDQPTPQLGWSWKSLVLGGFPQPLNSMHLRDAFLGTETWPEPGGPKGLLYLSGPFAGGWETRSEDPASRNLAATAARREAVTFVTNELAKALPQFTPASLFSGDAVPVGNDLLSAQYVRGNIERSSRYVLCIPGGLADRPRPVVDLVPNLFLAGDWTRNGVDIPCLEGAVTSALLAAQAILGEDLGILA